MTKYASGGGREHSPGTLLRLFFLPMNFPHRR